MGNEGSTTRKYMAPNDNHYYRHPAYQVLHVAKESPAERAGLVAYFDFITQMPAIMGFADCALSYEDYVKHTLARQANLELSVWSCATGRVRKVVLSPARYGCNGEMDLSGVLVRSVVPAEAIEQVEQVRDVSVGSAAFAAGLVPNFDFILALDDGKCFDLHRIVPLRPSLRLFVFDALLRTSRLLTWPTNLSNLQDNGSDAYQQGRRLGCTLARGYLHRIPAEPLHILVRDTATTMDPANLVCEHDHRHVTSGPEQRSLAHSACARPESKKRKCKRKQESASDVVGMAVEEDSNVCTFLTPLPLPHSEGVPLIPVSIPKQVVRQVVAELVQYERQRMGHANKQTEPQSTSTNHSLVLQANATNSLAANGLTTRTTLNP